MSCPSSGPVSRNDQAVSDKALLDSNTSDGLLGTIIIALALITRPAEVRNHSPYARRLAA